MQRTCSSGGKRQKAQTLLLLQASQFIKKPPVQSKNFNPIVSSNCIIPQALLDVAFGWPHYAALWPLIDMPVIR
jgi:hypothetical protein